MSFEKIISDIGQRKFSPIYFLYGEEPYFVDMILEKLDKTVLSDAEKSFNHITFYGKEVEFKMVVDHARQFPMMSPFKTVFLREAQEMRDIGSLESYFLNPSEQTILVITYKNKKPDKRTKWFKSLKNKALVFEAKKLYDNQIGPWIKKHVATKGIKIDDRASSLIAEYLGTNISKISNEMDKLCLNKKEGETITIEDIQKGIGISKDFNVFELQNALGKKDIVKANRIINYFEANPKANPIYMVFGALFSYFTKVYIVHKNLSLPDKELGVKAKIFSSYFLKDYKLAARNYNNAQLENVFMLLKKYDLWLKGIHGKSMDQGAILKELVYQILH